MTSTTSIAPADPTPARLQASKRLDELYCAASQQWPGFAERSGQVQMMRECLDSLLSARLDRDAPSKGENLAALEAGTGTGKTLAYCLAAIAASEATGFPVIVSTATVALQEQLVLKDLPALANIVPSLKFELLKGRSRYLCPSRLDGQLSGSAPQALDFDDEPPVFRPQESPASEQSVLWLANIRDRFAKEQWGGDLDELTDWPTDIPRRNITANTQQCRGSDCSYFGKCPVFQARRRAAVAHLVVANHALVLSSLQNESQWLDPHKCLFVFDEAHQLSDIAADQFKLSVRLSSVSPVAEIYRQALHRANKLLPTQDRQDLREAMSAIGRVVTVCDFLETTLYDSAIVTRESPVLRFAHGQIPQDIATQCAEALGWRDAITSTSVLLVAALKARVTEADSPKERESILQTHERLRGATADFGDILALFESWQRSDAVPLAKWIELEGQGDKIDLALCSSPLSGASALHQQVWSQVAAAVCTSATLQACGGFDFFLRLSGLRHYPGCKTATMDSPFDYAKQGTLSVPTMRFKPKDAGFPNELAVALPASLADSAALGQLVLFTSRRQMEACAAALTDALKAIVQVQGVTSRRQMLAEHRARIDRGERSVLFGLQSFGEGLDLPGAYCEHLLIDRLPFTPPGTPVNEALDEWLVSQGRDPFKELAVPRAGIRTAQWVGRAIRTVTDRATVTIFDKRLISTDFGRRILNGLPPLARAFA